MKEGRISRSDPATVAPSRLTFSAWLLLALVFAVFYALYFSPVLLQHGLLAPGDGTFYYRPFFELPATELWNDLLLSGYSALSDIQAQTLYPLRWLSPTFNSLVISAYLVAALGSFGLALSLTGSRIAALAAALVVSGSGFMLAHLGHLSIIHAAAWVPGILWALSSFRTSRTWVPVAAGALAVAMCIFGGHPQLSIIGMLFAGTYALSEICLEVAKSGWRAGARMLLKVFAMFSLGLMIASPALISLASAASSSVRSAWSLADFNSFSHDLASLRMLAFPNVYGAQPTGPYGTYSGPFNLTELALYVGVTPWLLCMLAVVQCKRDPRTVFWIVAAIVSLALCLGASTPLGEWIYRLPVLGKFRAQARFGWIFTVCMGVLSAYGISAVLRNAFSSRQKLAALSMGLALGALAVVSVALAPPGNVLAQGGDWYSHPAVQVPLVFMVVTFAVLGFFVVKPGHRSAAMLLLLLIIDLGSFGWFHDWRYMGPPPPVAARDMRGDALLRNLASGNGRVLTLGAEHWPAGPLRPNVNITHGVPLVVGYGPLLSSRYASLTGANTVGGFPLMPPDAPLLDVLGVRWVAGTSNGTTPTAMGAGCGTDTGVTALRAEIPVGLAPDAIRIVSHMSCSAQLATSHDMADATVADESGKPLESFVVEAGVNTAEWAYDRADVRATVAHARPHVFETFDAGGFNGLWFDATWAIQPMASAGRSVNITMRKEAGAPIMARSIEAKDSRTGAWVPLSFGPVMESNGTLNSPPTDVQGVPVSERLGYRGMAWIACSARVMALQEQGAILRGSRAKSRLDPRRTVLLEEAAHKPALTCKSPAPTLVVERRPGYWKLRTRSDGAGMLVVSTSFNSGWNASVDGVVAKVVPAYGLVLGIPIAAGEHDVELHFLPRSLVWALLIAGLAIIATLILLWRGRRGAFYASRNTRNKGSTE
ncbi:MAG: YfhO family protein [Pseudoxanthomonas sp.]